MTGSILGGRVLLERLTEITEFNLTNEQFGVTELAKNYGISRSNLHRKVKKEAKCSVSRFISRVRLQKSLELLQSTSLPVSEVAFDCGFHSVAYFSKCFRDYYGFPPAHAKIEKYPSQNP
jgi:transcriptional regulator GlxA family with amidase domain